MNLIIKLLSWEKSVFKKFFWNHPLSAQFEAEFSWVQCNTFQAKMLIVLSKLNDEKRQRREGRGGSFAFSCSKAICLHRSSILAGKNFPLRHQNLLGWLAYAVFDFSLLLSVYLKAQSKVSSLFSLRDVTTSHLVIFKTAVLVYANCHGFFTTLPYSGRWKRLIWWIIHNSPNRTHTAVKSL